MTFSRRTSSSWSQTSSRCRCRNLTAPPGPSRESSSIPCSCRSSVWTRQIHWEKEVGREADVGIGTDVDDVLGAFYSAGVRHAYESFAKSQYQRVLADIRTTAQRLYHKLLAFAGLSSEVDRWVRRELITAMGTRGQRWPLSARPWSAARLPPS